MTEYPEGAIKDVAEIKAFLKIARKTPVKLYSVHSEYDNELEIITLDELSRFVNDGFFLHVKRSRLKGSADNIISLVWRGIVQPAAEWQTKPLGFLFTNYWFAYAYRLRAMRKKPA